MPMITDMGIVLRTYDFSETSQIATVLTHRHGKVRAMAKGVRRGTRERFAPGIDLLDVGRLTLLVKADRSDDLCVMTEFNHARLLGGVRQTLDRFYAACYLLEITNALTEEWDTCPRLYTALIDALDQMSESDTALDAVTRYQRTLLIEAGSWPRFDTCLRCGRKTGLAFFSSLEGGMLCRPCAAHAPEKREVTAATLRTVRSPDKIDQSGAQPLGHFRLFDYHIAHLIGRPTRVGDRLRDRFAGAKPRKVNEHAKNSNKMEPNDG